MLNVGVSRGLATLKSIAGGGLTYGGQKPTLLSINGILPIGSNQPYYGIKGQYKGTHRITMVRMACYRASNGQLYPRYYLYHQFTNTNVKTLQRDYVGLTLPTTFKYPAEYLETNDGQIYPQRETIIIPVGIPLYEGRIKQLVELASNGRKKISETGKFMTFNAITSWDKPLPEVDVTIPAGIDDVTLSLSMGPLTTTYLAGDYKYTLLYASTVDTITADSSLKLLQIVDKPSVSSYVNIRDNTDAWVDNLPGGENLTPGERDILLNNYGRIDNVVNHTATNTTLVPIERSPIYE